MNAARVDHGAAARMPRRGVLASLKMHVCIPCRSGPFGKEGHAALRYVMLAPETDRSFFRCSECGERWVRSAGMTCRFTWTRYEAESRSRKENGLARI